MAQIVNRETYRVLNDKITGGINKNNDIHHDSTTSIRSIAIKYIETNRMTPAIEILIRFNMKLITST